MILTILSRLKTGLNRTSVGLKLVLGILVIRGWGEPQSNQRGIETDVELPQGLAQEPPQSNQRGIETASGPPGRLGPPLPASEEKRASIEPAWD